jgi:light-regulated signal transduction histidine kinase (bacteriophytochrome)
MVSSFLSLLEKKLGDKLDPVNKKYIDFAVDGAERMKKLIHDLLEYSRTGNRSEARKMVDCNEIMMNVRKLFALRIAETNATLVVSSLPVIEAVETEMQQLFQNLVSNALKYHNGKALQVEVGCTEEDQSWKFYVKDNGLGIDNKYFEKIFVIFQRLHNKSEYSGTGIGLSVCKKIVNRHGGEIWVTSELGKGSTFYFTIPKTQPCEKR